jgi:hypothetical protein
MHGGEIKANGTVDEVNRAAGCDTLGESFGRLIAASREMGQPL